MPKIAYCENGDIAVFNGVRYRRDKKSGYYLHTLSGGRTGTRLHRDVYEFYNGKIPKGHDIHHIDHNKNNNEIENLQLLEAHEHKLVHAAEMTDERKEWMRENLSENARPMANLWHKSEDGREWHKQHYEQMKDRLRVKMKFTCEECGKEFEALTNGRNRFCSKACSSAWRRKSGLDDVERTCAVCGKKFVINKYKKTKCCSRSCARKFKRGNSA